MLIDTHAHITDIRLRGDIPDIISSMNSDGLSAIVEIGACLDSSRRAAELAAAYDNVYCTAGLHPHEARDYTEGDIDIIEKIAMSGSKTVAIGEMGLDYYYDDNREEQMQLFALQLRLADKLGLPTVLHMRDATEDTLQVLSENKRFINNGVLFHCYNGSLETVKILSDNYDCYFAFGGAITFKNNNKSDIIRAVPIDRLLLETDCPYLTPTPYRGGLNYPRNINLVADKIAQMLDMPRERVDNLTTENALRFYRI